MCIILIGLPGSGKTTLSKEYSKQYKIDGYDTDEIIQTQLDLPIKDYIKKYGFDKFREIEINVFKNLVKELNNKREPVIVATGGGIVESPEFYKCIGNNFDIIYIKRDNLEIDEVFYGTTMSKLASKRNPLYLKYSDGVYNNNQRPSSFCEWISNYRI